MNYLYHITSPQNLDRIISVGINCSQDEYIYLVHQTAHEQNLEGVCNFIAKNQLFLEKFVILKVDEKGITEKVEGDNVAELTAVYQRRVKQEKIDSEYLSTYMNVIYDTFDKKNDEFLELEK